MEITELIAEYAVGPAKLLDAIDRFDEAWRGNHVQAETDDACCQLSSW